MSERELDNQLILNTVMVLDELATDIERIGAGLCCDTDIIERHAVQLQGIDVLAQTARNLAEVLRSDCATTAISNVSLESLKMRLGNNVS